jgi:hypothetical protein
MGQLRTLVFTAALATATLGTSLLTIACGTRAEGRISTVSVLNASITIDPFVRETFGPAPASARPALTARQAWAMYTKVNTSYKTSAIPSNITVYLGLLTLPTGPNGSGPYTAHNELAYGYSWHSCPVSRNPRVKRLPANPCREWNFLDANTGRQIDETWQM